MGEKVTCKICNLSTNMLTNSHLKKHNILPKDYLKLYPTAILTSGYTKKKRSSSMFGHITSEETKRKLSLAHKGKKLSKEHCRKISLIQRGIKRSEEFKQKLRDYNKVHGNSFKGRKHTAEAKSIIGLKSIGRIPWNKGKTWPEITRQKIRTKLMGRSLSLETRIKMSQARKGMKLSLETRKKLSIAKKGLKFTMKHLNNLYLSRNISPNKFENWAIALFKDNNLPLRFVGDFKDPGLYIEGKVPDFVATNSKKVLVEIYSDYFKIKDYGSVENYKVQRNELFSKYEWKTLFFSEKELKTNPNKCIDELRGELLK